MKPNRANMQSLLGAVLSGLVPHPNDIQNVDPNKTLRTNYSIFAKSIKSDRDMQ